MVTGILLAGGTGERMRAGIPKQFIKVMGKPVICYPLGIMENHPLIDVIEIVCVEGFIEKMRYIVKNYNYKKVKWITRGGATCQESTWKGLRNLRYKLKDDDIVLIHMSSYPLANNEIISGCIESAVKNGNGCTARTLLYSAFLTDDKLTATSSIDRDKIMICTIPYAFRFGECLNLYDRAFAENKYTSGSFFTNTLYCSYGKRIYFTRDSEMNIKITTPEDIKLMTALLSEDNIND